jgi:hypothetical protein
MRTAYSLILVSSLLLLLGISVGCRQVEIPTSVAPATVPAIPTDMAATEKAETTRPSNLGGPGPGLNLTGDSIKDAQVFVNCVPCHGA